MKQKVLVVDDEWSLRLTFRYALESGCYVVDEAENGENALELAGKRDYDLIFLDQQMPGLNGTDVLRRLNEQSVDAPVVMVSAYGNREVETEARRLGCVAFLHKPVTPEELRSIVSKVLA